MTIATIDSKETVKEIQQIHYRLKKANSQTNAMLLDLDSHKDEISRIEKKVKDKWYKTSPSNNELFELIKSDQKSNSKTTTSISKLISSINSNTDDLAKMIQGLSALATMTYSELKDSVSEIENLYKSQSSIGEKIGFGQNHMNDLIRLQIAKAKKEHEFETNIRNMVDGHIDNIEKSFSLINEFENRLEQIKFAVELSDNLKREKDDFLAEREIFAIKSENEWKEIKVEKSQLKRIKMSFIISVVASIISLCALVVNLL